MITDCTAGTFSCPTPRGARPRRIEADFSGGAITSCSGLLLAGLAELPLCLFDRLAACFDDHRHPELVVHDVETLVGQRILGLLAGYEDLNDHDDLRKDPVIGAVLGCLVSKREDCEPLAGKSTLNRLELSASGIDARKARKIVADFDKLDALLVDLLVEDHEREPEEIVLDIDATDFALHGTQEDRFYHGYYREYCYLPVLMFVDRHPVLVRLRTASKDVASGIGQELSRVIRRIRAHWPATHIIVRTDSGFCRDEIMTFIEAEDHVDYVIGLARNARLSQLCADAMEQAMASTRETQEACRRFCTFRYRTLKSWSAERRVIAKAEALPGHTDDAPLKANSRFIVTSLDAATHPGPALYESFYCARGDAENRLKEVKCDLFAERSSSNLFDANALRLYLSSFAHVLYNRVRRALATTPLAKANPVTVRLKLFRIGARVTMSARRIHVAMSGACPDKTAFAAAWKALAPG